MRKSDITGFILLAFVLGCRYCAPLADFYAERCYPVISAVLSRIAAVVPFSLEEIVVIGFAAALIAVPVRSIRKKEGFFPCLGKTGRVVLWLVVWLYIGWGINYFRTPLYQRNGITPAEFEDAAFSRFIADYTDALNGTAGPTTPLDRKALEADIKTFYAETLPAWGYPALRPWQHVKKPLVNRLYSAVRVLGFMGPFFCETQLNLDLTEREYPFTLAHELAHLSGVTSEAEANYWAYAYCRQSGNPAVRYSGHMGLFPYAATSAASLWTEDRYTAWKESVSDSVKDDYTQTHAYWEAKRIGFVDAIQQWMMDRFLKTNGIADGARDYVGVIGMLMTMDGGSSN